MKYLLLFLLGFSVLNEAETIPNYESIALQYYIDSIENKDVFQSSCDCKEEYFTKKTLKVYDSTGFGVGLEPFIRNSKGEKFREDTPRKVVLDKLPKRIKLTANLNHYRSWHYYIKFGNRIYFEDKVLIIFSLKHYERCSSQDFSFVLNINGEILEYTKINWCDEN